MTPPCRRFAPWAAGPALGLTPLAASAAPMSYLTGYGAKAYPVTNLTWGLLVISIVVVVIVTILLVWGVLARRSRSAFGGFGAEPVEHRGDGLRWITVGLAVSSVALVASLIWTVAVLAKVNQPSNAAPFTIEVTGEQWWWNIRYLGAEPARVFSTANELHVPVGVPVKIRLRSDDVIHSFWIPALAGKTDTIPGQTNVTWIEADRPGRYLGQCTEYCGLQHSHMGLELVADPPAAFEAWWARQLQAAAPPNAADASRGEVLFVQRCGACHTVRGTGAGGTVAPDLTHLMDRRTLAAGAAPNTVAGLSGWIANPQGVKPGTKMPTLYLSGADLGDVRAFLETLK